MKRLSNTILILLLFISTARSQTIPTAGLSAWFRADSGVDTLSTGRVAAWTSAVLPLTIASQTIDLNRPRYIRNAINGKPAIEFDGNDFLATGTLAFDAFTVFTVFRSTNSSLGIVYEHGPNSNEANGTYLSTSTNQTVNVRRGTDASANHLTNWAHDGAYRIVSTSYAPTQSPRIKMGINGNNLGLQSTGAPSEGLVSQPLYLGARSGGVLGLQGRIAEFIIYNRILTQAQIDSVDLYLSQKYAIETVKLTVGEVTTLSQNAALFSGTVNPNGATVLDVKFVYGRAPDALTDTLSVTPNVAGQSGFTPINVSAQATSVKVGFNVVKLIARTSNGVTEGGTFSFLTPLPVPGQQLSLWLRGDEVDTGSGGYVPLWRNLISNSLNASISGGISRQPRWVQNSVNGLPALEFDGTDVLITNEIFFTNNPVTAFIVFRSTGSGVTLLFEHSGNTNTQSGMFLNTSTGATIQARRGNAFQARDFVTNWGNDSLFRYVTNTYDGILSEYSLRVNSKEMPLTNGNNSQSSTSGSVGALVYIGGRGGTPVSGFRGQIAEILLYNQKLSESARDSVEQYLSTRYAIQVPNEYATRALPVVSTASIPFGTTGVTLSTTSAILQTGPVATVQRFDTAAQQVTFSGQAPTSVRPYRFVFSQGVGIPPFSGILRFNRTVIPNAGLSDPQNVRVYYRPTIGTGDFTILPNAYDPSSPDEVRAFVTLPMRGEFILGLSPSPLSVLDNQLPRTFDIQQNYPNPFNPSTRIAYQLPTREMVTLEVFDLLGRTVTTLVNQRQDAGRFEVNFNASHLSSGVYFYRLQAGSFTKTMKMMLVK